MDVKARHNPLKGGTEMYNIAKIFFVIISLAGFVALPASAAELNMSVNAVEKTVTVQNLLAQPIYLVSVVGGTTYLPLNAELASGGTATVPFTGDFPATVDFANCFPTGPDAQAGIAGFNPGPTGTYQLTVDLQ